VDNVNNNTGMGDTQNTNQTPNVNTYNSMQPVTDLVNDLSGMPDVKDDNRPVEEFPNQINTDSVLGNTTAPLDSVPPVNQSPVSDLGVFNTSQVSTTETPVSIPTEMAVPTMETPVSMPTEMSAPTMETPVSIPTEMPAPTMETPVSTPTEMPLPTQDLSQPFEQFSTSPETPMPAFQDTEVVNTLTNEKGDKGKGGTAVVIVLIVVIVALLVTIGYFAYKIFFA